jgi:hypothetical protein
VDTCRAFCVGGCACIARSAHRGSADGGIRTKTANPGSQHFQLGKKDEQPGTGGNEWYVFVGLKDLDARPDFYVMPRGVVAAVVYLEHRAWLTLKGYDESPTPMRTIRRSWIEPYLEQWSLLRRSAMRAPCLLRETFFAAAQDYGWPDGLSGLRTSRRGHTGGPLEHWLKLV